MSDTQDILPKSRRYFRDFIKSHLSDIYNAMIEYRIAPKSGYGPFYKSDEVVPVIAGIYHTLTDHFGNVTIPGEFTSPQKLIASWKAFNQYLLKQEVTIKKVEAKLISSAKIKYGKDFKHLMESGMILPAPFVGAASVLYTVKDVLSYILNMQEIQDLSLQKPSSTKSISSKIADETFDIVVITALHDTEFEALMKLPVNIKPYSPGDDPTDYRECIIGSRKVLLATDDSMGMASAAALTTKIIAKYSPSFVIMAGIAGGVKDDEKSYGDILVCRIAFNYESGKYKYNVDKKQSIFEPNPEQISIAPHAISKINKVKSQLDKLSQISDGFKETKKDKKPKGPLNVFIGPVASGSAVIGDSRKIENIRAGNRKLIGIDMETYGVMYAAAKYSNSNKTTAICIKSISDFADQRKSDKYRKYAAYTSAMFIYELILQELQ